MDNLLDSISYDKEGQDNWERHERRVKIMDFLNKKGIDIYCFRKGDVVDSSMFGFLVKLNIMDKAENDNHHLDEFFLAYCRHDLDGSISYLQEIKNKYQHEDKEFAGLAAQWITILKDYPNARRSHIIQTVHKSQRPGKKGQKRKQQIKQEIKKMNPDTLGQLLSYLPQSKKQSSQSSQQFSHRPRTPTPVALYTGGGILAGIAAVAILFFAIRK